MRNHKKIGHIQKRQDRKIEDRTKEGTRSRWGFQRLKKTQKEKKNGGMMTHKSSHETEARIMRPAYIMPVYFLTCEQNFGILSGSVMTEA